MKQFMHDTDFEIATEIRLVVISLIVRIANQDFLAMVGKRDRALGKVAILFLAHDLNSKIDMVQPKLGSPVPNVLLRFFELFLFKIRHSPFAPFLNPYGWRGRIASAF